MLLDAAGGEVGSVTGSGFDVGIKVAPVEEDPIPPDSPKLVDGSSVVGVESTPLKLWVGKEAVPLLPINADELPTG